MHRQYNTETSGDKYTAVIGTDQQFGNLHNGACHICTPVLDL